MGLNSPSGSAIGRKKMMRKRNKEPIVGERWKATWFAFWVELAPGLPSAGLLLLYGLRATA